MRMIALLAALALAVPAAALATKPPSPGKPDSASKPAGALKSKAAPQVRYVLHGTLTAYTAASGAADGSVSVYVKGSNHHAKSLQKQTLTFVVTATTKVVAEGGTVTIGDRGVVKVRGPKSLAKSTDLATQLQAIAARQVIDQGQPTG